MPITYYVVVPFGRDEGGNLVPLEPAEARSADAARRRARFAAEKSVGGVAFSRTGDPATGVLAEAEVVAMVGLVDISMLG